MFVFSLACLQVLCTLHSHGGAGGGGGTGKGKTSHICCPTLYDNKLGASHIAIVTFFTVHGARSPHHYS